MSADATSAARESRRVPAVTRCRRHDGDGSWFSVNLSEGGAFLRGGPLLCPGTELRLGVALPDSAVEIIGGARVVWTNDPTSPGTDPRLPAGMGITFTDLDSDSRRMLRASLYGDMPTGDGLQLERPRDSDEEILEPGALVGSYRIHERLGSGGMSHVYRAEHLGLGRMVALKCLRGCYSSDRDAIRRFFDEGRVVNRVRHPHVVEVTDFISEGPQKYYVMELLEGRSLATELGQGGALPVERVLDIAIQLFDTLTAVHQAGIVHRDLKPDNIFLVDRLDQPDFVKLLDFGVAKMTLPDGGLLATVPGLVVGTPTYMAPEHSLGEPPDARSDIYSAGHVLYQLATGQLAFQGGNWAEVLRANMQDRPTPPSRRASQRLPRALDRLIMRCLEKHPAARPQSAADVANQLRAIRFDYGSEPVTDAMLLPLDSLAERLGAARLLDAAVERLGAPALLAGAGLLVAAMLIGLVVLLNGRELSPPAPSMPPASLAVTPEASVVAPAQQPASAAPAKPAGTSKAAAKRAPTRRVRPKKARKVHRRGTIDPFDE